jgi:hypothetical protein
MNRSTTGLSVRFFILGNRCAVNDEGDSPIEMHINSGACEPVNDFMRELAVVLRKASS